MNRTLISSHIKSILQKMLGGRIVWNYNDKQKKLCLTFDDGPHPVYTPLVMDILEKYGICGTFFVVGNKVVQYPNIVQQIVERGHLVGNHSFSHRIELKNGIKKFSEEIRCCNETIFDASNSLCRLFRPPWGIITPGLLLYCVFNNLKLVLWSFDSHDYKHELHRGIAGAESGDIILLHDDAQLVLEILKKDVPLLLDKGFTFISGNQL